MITTQYLLACHTTINHETWAHIHTHTHCQTASLLKQQRIWKGNTCDLHGQENTVAYAIYIYSY
jgi:hypothetical protein